MIRRAPSLVSGRPWAWGPAALVAAMLAASCATPTPRSYTAEELRQEIWRRIGSLAAGEIVVPFDVSAADVQRARSQIAQIDSHFERAHQLKEMLFSADGFGLEYALGVTASAAETLQRGRGNCLSLASVYVGLARGVGLRAHYLDASGQINEVHQGEQLLVKSGHVTAVVESESGKVALDFGRRLNRHRIFRVMSDVEATAHFYNNRGYELILQAEGHHRSAPWREVARAFALSTRVMPDFASAWNNLGVALVRLGRPREAQACYQVALRKDPDSSSPYTNLGVLALAQGDLAVAARHFRQAARRDPASAHVCYYLGLTLLRAGDAAQAVEQLRRAIELGHGYPRAQKLLERIQARSPRR